MTKKIEFHSVEFFRKVRDEHAAELSGKSTEEIITFFSTEPKSRRTNKASSRPRSSTAEA